jgi:hypothetical protein
MVEKKKDKYIDNDIQNITPKAKDWATWTPLKTGVNSSFMIKVLPCERSIRTTTKRNKELKKTYWHIDDIIFPD